jgi:ElaB/YqjD/DUF883 family membrane-anchored ribosome-binding protein
MEAIVRDNTPATSGMLHNTEDAVNKASTSAHAVVNSIVGAADEAADKAKPVIDQVAAMVHQVVDRAASAAAPTAEWLTEQGENINVRQKQLVADTRDYVSANPLKAVGIAVVAGFLLSRLIRR